MRQECLWGCAWLLLLGAAGLHAVPAPAPAPAPGPDPAAPSSGWPDLWSWGVLRIIRDTTSDNGNGTRTATTDSMTESVRNSAQAFSKQASDRVASVWQSVRSSAANSWQGVQGALDKLTGGGRSGSGFGAGASAGSSLPNAEKMQVEASDKVDVTPNLRYINNTTDNADNSTATEGEVETGTAGPPHAFVTSALERVRGAARTFGEVGRAVSSTVTRWSKVMAGTMGTAAGAVNTAVGTVWQVINGGKQSDDIDHVCYDGLGCFSLREPWISSQRPLPRMNSPEQVQTKFFLHVRNVTEPEELLQVDGLLPSNSSFDPQKKTFFIVHGFNDKCVAAWVEDMKNALLDKVDSNVVLVDWSQGALASKNYLQAASNTRIVGAELARLMEAMSEQMSMAMDRVHVIGHSLGAHAAGYAGKRLGGRPGRITALDAAQPAFEDQDAEVRVAPSDASFVDAIHTNGVPFIPTLGLGLMHSVADVDFYLNGGTVQPGCFVPKLPAVNSLADLAALPVSVLGDMLSCSHRRAIEYFTEAIRSDCRMWGRLRVDDDSKAEPSSDSLRATSERPAAGAAAGVTRSSSSWWRPSPGFSLLASVFSSEPTKPTTETSLIPFLSNMFSGARTTPVPPPAPSKRSAPPRATEPPPPPPSRPTAAPATPLPADRLPRPSWCGEDCLPLGLDSHRYGVKGTYDVATSDHSPYCMTDASNEV